MARPNLFVRPGFMIAAFVALVIIGCFVIKAVGPAVVEIIDPPVVYKSYSTGKITQIEIGGQVYTPGSDREWKQRVDSLKGKAYEQIYVE